MRWPSLDGRASPGAGRSLVVSDGAPDVGRGTAAAGGGARWYQHRRFWRAFLARYLPGMAAANLAWEVAQLPLYPIWAEEPPGSVLYAVAHCTAGDVLIAGSALLLAMCLAAPRGFPERGLVRAVIVATLVGLAYTAFSEWLNTAVRASWAYAPSMPIVPFIGVGLTPFLQWLLLPPAVLFIAFRRQGLGSSAPAGASR